MEPDGNDALVHPKIVFTRARLAYSGLQSELDKAEWQLGGVESMLEYRFHRLLPQPFRAEVEGRLLSGRAALIAVLAVERGRSLGMGLAVELEDNRLFPAASIARSLMELVGLLIVAYDQLTALGESDPIDIDALNEETMRYLVASRSSPAASDLAPVKIPNLINAACGRFGDAFGEDYGFLSDLAHLNASAAFGLELIEESAEIAVLRDPPVSEAQAEVFIKILAIGLHAVQREALLLIEWAASKHVVLAPE